MTTDYTQGINDRIVEMLNNRIGQLWHNAKLDMDMYYEAHLPKWAEAALARHYRGKSDDGAVSLVYTDLFDDFQCDQVVEHLKELNDEQRRAGYPFGSVEQIGRNGATVTPDAFIHNTGLGWQIDAAWFWQSDYAPKDDDAALKALAFLDEWHATIRQICETEMFDAWEQYLADAAFAELGQMVSDYNRCFRTPEIEVAYA